MKRVSVINAAFAASLASLVLAACGGGGGNTPNSVDNSSAVSTSALGVDKLDGLALGASQPDSKIDSRLSNVKGKVSVWVTLVEASAAAKHSATLATSKIKMTKQMHGDHATVIAKSQSEVMASMSAMGATELARVSKALNAIAIEVDASNIHAIASLSGVLKVQPAIDYQMDLSETVPYIGAAQAQTLGKDGTGVRVAVIDSGIDYTHKNLGGEGTAAAYAAAYGATPADPKNTTLDGLFPTKKVVAGYDFVGEQWPNGPRTEDPDPIDFEGHGTHVADIIAGRSVDGTHVGVAPGASLVAIKACSAVSSSCNGIALLKAVDFALDPNGDGDLSDAVDVINMSLGSSYGQQENALAEAAANAVRMGVIVVVSAGNSADRPYIVGSPSSAPGVISVAQTQVPSARSIPLIVNSPASIARTYGNTATVDWAPIGNGFSNAPVSYVGRGCPAAGATPADAYLDNPAGKIALIDRGSCSISLKVERAAQAGATGVLLALTAAGDAVSFSNGGGTVFVPTLVIQQSLGAAIKANIAAPVLVSASNSSAISLLGSMVASSSRGPGYSDSAIKPEIGAPGASVSAIAGSGTGQGAFGGTSGAAPMVAGSAAILRQAFRERSADEIKAMLMNSAETKVYTNPALLPGVLAPITRIGSGEVRVDRALKLNAAVWDEKAKSAALSFGYRVVSGTDSVSKELRLKNFAKEAKTFTVQTSFRYANDAADGAVKVSAPSKISVGGESDKSFEVSIQIDGSKLPAWGLNGGSRGGNGSLLQGNEYDGYVTFTSGTEVLSVPWHVLPHKAADVSAPRVAAAGQTVVVRNNGIETGIVEQFALTGVSPRVDNAALPKPGDGFAIIDIRAVGARLAAPGIVQFAINTFGARAHPNYPAEFDIGIDTNGDGVEDYVVYNGESGTFGSSGQNVVNVVNLATGVARAFYFADADLNSSNMIMTVPLSALGLTDSSTFKFTVKAFDNYFTGNLTDEIGVMTFTPSTPKYVGTGIPDAGIPALGRSNLAIAAVAGGDTASPSQTGLLLMYRNQSFKREADVISIR